MAFIANPACASKDQAADTLKPFATDGCSLFPDGSPIGQKDWCGCCVAHDVAYWQGGTRQERRLADEALKDCIKQKTDNEPLSVLMYNGVRFGGSPYFPNWYRWGYGWPYDRKYQPLTPGEKKLAADLLAGRIETVSATACRVQPRPEFGGRSKVPE
ncbi:MAG: FAD-binding oxidoreductase [Proteobacteria bacterium]|nr:FAD-binding oxidoreductase [Pseudomonadota bacterium]